MAAKKKSIQKVVHFVEFFFKGNKETEIREVKNQSLEGVKIPTGAYAYKFFDRYITVMGTNIKIGKRSNQTELLFFDNLIANEA